jgi:tetrahydromethanopterin S-methyltransferase subunit G
MHRIMESQKIHNILDRIEAQNARIEYLVAETKQSITITIDHISRALEYLRSKETSRHA